MNGSMWLLTATCLACGAPDSAIAPAPVQSSPAPLVISSSDVSSQTAPRTTGGYWYGGTPATAPIEDGSCCNEHPGFLARFFSRLRSLFCRSHSDSCVDGVAQCGTGRSAVCENCGDGGSHGLGLRDRLARLFHHSSPEDTCCTSGKTMVVQMLPPSAVLPPVQMAAVQPAAPVPPPSPIVPVSTRPAQPAAPPTFEIAKEYVHKVANADDYSWVTGQLFYIHIHSDQGLWFVRYAPVDKEDRYGGSVVLAPATSMTNFREGDLVTVHGEILNQGRASRYLGGPLYRALAVELKERAHPQ